jgi:exodeoxyribonuclease V beta subunit
MTPEPLKVDTFQLDPRLVVVEAGAGSGKTYNLVRIVRKMSEAGRDISRVLLVTFTNAAALEMRQRMRELLEKEGSPTALQQLASMQITTIHSFCHRAYSEYGPMAGFPTIEGAPQDSGSLAQAIGTDFWRKKTRDGSDRGVSPREIVRATELLLGENEAAGQGIRLSLKLQNSGLREFVKSRVAELQAAGGLLTFDTVIQNLLDALRDPVRGKTLRASIRADFDACLIDESQDTDAKQWEVFEQTFGNRPTDEDPKLLIMVGDRKQSIYGFRGANVDNYKQVVAKAEQQLGLNENNRSSEDLIALFNRLFADRPGQGAFFGTEPFPPIQIPQRPKDDPRPKIKAKLLNCVNGPIRVLDQNKHADIVNEVARMLLELQTPGTSDEALTDNEAKLQKEIVAETTIGVLTRTGASARNIHLALVNQGIPAALASQSSVFTAPLAPRLHHLLQAVLTPEDASIRRALFVMQPRLFGQTGDLQSFMDANDAELAAWLREVRATWLEDGFGRAWEHLLGTHPKLTTLADSTLRTELAKGPMGLRQLADLSHIGEILCIRARQEKLTPDALLDHLAKRISSASDRDDDADELEQIRPETAHPQVIVRTIHSAKGLEFHGVILPEFGKTGEVSASRGGLLRDGNRIALVSDSSDAGEVARYAEQSNKDEANLLYVALTRAQRRISVHWKPPRNKSGGGLQSGFPVVMAQAGLGDSAAGFAAWLGVEVSAPAPDSSVRELLASGILKQPAFIQAREGKAPFVPFERGSTSFTELSKGPKGQDADDVATHGVNELKSTTKPTEKDLETLPFLAFKGGKGPGVVMHSILEQVDFVDAARPHPGDETAKVVERLLRSSGICLQKDGKGTEAALQETTQLYLKMLPRWMNRPLSGQGQVKLGELSRQDRSSEIRFSLRCDIDAGSIQSIAAALAQDARPGSMLADTPIEPSVDTVRGLLTGSIDLAFRKDGVFYIVDWKSNVLGPKPAHYRAEVMDAEILAHKYHLQYTIYAMVFHRHMRTLVPDWDYEKHFGGCHYLFMRGFGHDEEGLGDHFHRPAFTTIRTLLQALGHHDA